jgi:NAD+ kinase
MKILLVPKHTQIEEYLKKGQLPDKELYDFLLSKNLDAADIFTEYNNHSDTIDLILSSIEKKNEYGSKNKLIHYDIVYPERLSSFQYKDYDIIMPIGGDGTLLQAAHYANDELFFGVKSRDTSIGHWLSTDRESFEADLEKIMNKEYSIRGIRRLNASIHNDNPINQLALNEVFVGKLGLKMSKYKIIANGQEEKQYSSGIVAALLEGSTGWIDHIPGSKKYFGYESEIQWKIREPKNYGRDFSLGGGFCNNLKIISLDKNQVVSLDADEEKFCYPLNSGHYVNISISDKPLHIIYTK